MTPALQPRTSSSLGLALSPSLTPSSRRSLTAALTYVRSRVHTPRWGSPHLPLPAQFYISPASVGKPRGEVVVSHLAELNSYVRVSTLHEGAVSDAVLRRFHAVVVTCTPRATAVAWNAVCRSASPAIPFLVADVLGAAGYAFADFGPAHTVKDKNGEVPRSAVVTGVSVLADGRVVVYTHDSKRHGMDDGDAVAFREVEGLPALNDGKPRRIMNAKAHSFELVMDAEDAAAVKGWGEHTAGGMVEQVKVPEVVAYASLSDRLVAPVPKDDPMGMMLTPDLGKFGRSEQLHAAVQGVELYRALHGGAAPPLHDAAAGGEVVTLARTWLSGLAGEGKLSLAAADLDVAVVRTVAAGAAAELPSLCTFFGGVLAQEVVKATGKFTPLRQWLYLDAFEVLPPADASAAADEFAPRGDRYDHLTVLLGRTLQGKMMAQRVFVVGAGALGCEFMKNFALAGIGCGPEGRITITDMDRIEVSNLNRQFLFRSWNVGAPKSTTAAAAARAMNGDMRVEALEIAVGEDTEGTFNDAFWNGLDVVVNALDNVKARQYVDGRVVFYGKPLLESGTLGTKANTQVVVPGLTESYSDSVDPPEESIPMCTLRNFPHAIEHCIEWARDVFAGSFFNSVQDAAAFAAAPALWLEKAADESNLAARRPKLEGVLACIEAKRTASYATFVRMARAAFDSHFYTQICQLLHNFPPDYADKTTGVKFWSGPKRPPTAAAFDSADPVHLAFVKHSVVLLAFNYDTPLPAGWDSPAVLGPALAALPPATFVPKSVRIKSGEGDTTVEGGDDDGQAVEEATRRLTELAPAALTALTFAPAEFEKDDDSNSHIDFIAATSNLRARNYRIKEAGRHEVKMTAGKIIPAIATTTCAVTGLVTLELYKVVAGRPLEALRNSFLNLAVNVYSMGEPAGPKRVRSVAYDPISMGPVRAYPENFSRWDKMVIKQGDLTCAGLEAFLKATHKLDLGMVTSGKFILYNPMMYRKHREERGPVSLRALYERVTGAPVPAGRGYICLELSVSDDEGDVLVPPVQFFFTPVE
jgi:ubiquitin-activating enzyme E1